MMRRLQPASAIFLIFSATPALAAGYGLKEHSAGAMGASYAGVAADDTDASAIAYNPAALGGVKTLDGSISLTEILPGSNAHYQTALTSAGTPTGGSLTPSNFIGDALVPAVALRWRLSPRWIVGLSVGAPWGLATKYKADWAGRYYALKTKLLTLNTTPMIAYQPTPELSLGAGLQIEYAKGTLTSAIDTGTLGALNSIPGAIPGAQDSYATVKGTDWSFGFTLGVIWKPSPGLTLGASYRSAVEHKAKGSLRFTLDSAGVGATLRAVTGLFTDTQQTTALTMPDMVSLGARQDLSEQWSVMAELDWTNWSRFKTLPVNAVNPAQPTDVTTARWKDAVFGSLGLEYRANRTWMFRTGVAYDQSPAPDATVEPRIPDADRIWLSAGVRYRASPNMDVQLGYAHLFNLQRTVNLNPAIPGGALRGTLVGTTDSYVDVVGLQLDYRAD